MIWFDKLYHHSRETQAAVKFKVMEWQLHVLAVLAIRIRATCNPKEGEIGRK